MLAVARDRGAQHVAAALPAGLHNLARHQVRQDALVDAEQALQCGRCNLAVHATSLAKASCASSTLPGADYAVTYYKAPRQLLAKSYSGREVEGAPMTRVEFHARAWRLANDKARELG